MVYKQPKQTCFDMCRHSLSWTFASHGPSEVVSPHKLSVNCIDGKR